MNNPEQINFFAKTNFRNQQVPFGIKPDDRRRHMYIIGKTGMGKTTMMENMVIQDIRNGNGVCFIDPHGDSIQKILDYVPQSRINDVVYFNPADLEHPIAFNILESVETRYKHLVASGLMGVFTKIWASMWSSRMEYILNNTILALLDSPGNTMLGIVRMYVDKKYRKKIVDNIKDPMVRAFWIEEFANYAEKYRTEAVAPIQNKVGQFLSSAVIRNIVGQPKSTIDLRDIMDNNKILLLDLSKGKVGEDNSALLGAMIITKLQLAALSRVDIPEQERKDFYLYVDEFQNFVTDSFATILSEARKYRLNLTMGHQYIGQLTPENNNKVRDAVFGNVGTMVVFRVGAADAEYLETEFEPAFTPNDIVNLPKYHIILRLMINGIASDPFTAVTIPVNDEWFVGSGEKVIKVSRERYAKPREQVEDKIQRWMGTDFHEASADSHSSEAGERSVARTQLSKQPPEASLGAADESATTHKPQIQIASDYLERVKQAPKGSAKIKSPHHRQSQDQSQPLKSERGKPQAHKTKTRPRTAPKADIWQTVQALSEEKTESLAKHVSQAVESALGKSEQDSQPSKSDSFTVKRSNNSKPPHKPADQDSNILNPGQTYEL
ncbi:MAG TPA: type IV secretion system DNA-binding domain-containing protein [Candidatus Doudnabacteria bacterium]|nr:type IV secretion system DNA-binding domain-containing protein [Candidatus Doudnabacteria bacterium]